MASRSDGITRLYEVPQVPESERLPQPPKTKDKVLLDERGLLDLPFLALTVLLVLIGVVMVFSASYARAYYLKGNSTYYFDWRSAPGSQRLFSWLYLAYTAA